MNSHRLEFSQKFCFHTPPPALHRSSSDCPAHDVSPRAATSRTIPTFRMWLTGISPLAGPRRRAARRGAPHPCQRGTCDGRSLGPLAGSLRVQREGDGAWDSRIRSMRSPPHRLRGSLASRSPATLLTPDVILPWRGTGRGVFHRRACPAGGTNLVDESGVGRSAAICPLTAFIAG